jgi:hypothetical protein
VKKLASAQAMLSSYKGRKFEEVSTVFTIFCMTNLDITVVL